MVFEYVLVNANLKDKIDHNSMCIVMIVLIFTCYLFESTGEYERPFGYILKTNNTKLRLNLFFIF